MRKPHTCSNSGDAVRVEVLAVNCDAKRRAATTLENPSQIRSTVIQNASIAALGQLPSTSTMCKAIERVRNREDPAIPVPTPKNRQQIVFTQEYSRYEVTPGVFQNYLLAESGAADPDRIVVFGRESHGNWADQMKDLYVDGTFLLTPPLFSQIFVIYEQ